MDLKSELLEIDKLKAELDLLRPLSVKQLENLKRLFDKESLEIYLDTLKNNIIWK